MRVDKDYYTKLDPPQLFLAVRYIGSVYLILDHTTSTRKLVRCESNTGQPISFASKERITAEWELPVSEQAGDRQSFCAHLLL